eukprot:TRINITY_DN173_c0_g1_i1.p2 TRINITY_DN173_c0_g1~~TRINITY_DN173_c0_g1_i1.p2  ORF type:complete len:184 (-),score=33.13 TRINITY_DN173_c0_g1_i1:99-650(-)
MLRQNLSPISKQYPLIYQFIIISFPSHDNICKTLLNMNNMFFLSSVFALCAMSSAFLQDAISQVVYAGGVNFEDILNQEEVPENLQELNEQFSGFINGDNIAADSSIGVDLDEGFQSEVGTAIANFEADFENIDLQGSASPVATEFSSLLDKLRGFGDLLGKKKGSFETAPVNNMMADILKQD